jgi:SAM-dependent methyltransferase
LGLLCYPFLIEPLFDLEVQAQGWRLGFFALLTLLTACALLTSLRGSPALLTSGLTPGHTPDAQSALHSPGALVTRPDKRHYALWLALAALPSGLLVAITSHLTTDMVALPLMWVPPLALYLLTFIIAFAAKPIISARMAQFIAPFALMLLCLSIYNSEFGGIVVGASIILFLFFCIVLACHTALVARQPDPHYLTHFYLTLAAGGALGGGATALLPPLIFEWKAELPLLIMATAGLLAALNHGKTLSTSPTMGFLYGTRHRLLGDLLIPVVCGVLSFYYVHLEAPIEVVGRYATLLPLLALLVVLTYFSRTNALRFALCIGANLLTFGVWAELRDDKRIFQERNFFGRFYVTDYTLFDARLMVHGTTVHGAQTLSLARRKIPLTYYAAGSGVADALLSASPLASVGIVGLGTGALACYKKPGQNWSIFEIDPAMVKLATRSRYFDYVPRCAPNARIVLGDARLTLTREPDARYDYLVIDAFSSDAIPLHMITAEAFALYRAKLKPGGILLVHISNRVLNLEPVLARVAEVQGWQARILDYDSGDSVRGRFVTSSIWVAMAAPGVTSVPFDPTAGDRGWALLPKANDFRLWTDSYANVLAVVRKQNLKL